MDLFQKVGIGATKTNTDKIKYNFLSKLGIRANALKRIQLDNDIYQNQKDVEKIGLTPRNAYVKNPIIEEQNAQLALNNPVKFIQKFANKEIIENAIKTNPQIEKILKDNKLPVQYNLENVTSIIMSHLIPTAKKAQEIYTKMGNSKTSENYVLITQAGLLHDIGKVFIPSEILNKNGRLSIKEREIVELHNQLSYEILKTAQIDPRVAKLTKEHHDYNGDLKRNNENQALTIADVYCALRENRPYKKPISDIYAKMILYDMGTKGKFDPRVIAYLN